MIFCLHHIYCIFLYILFYFTFFKFFKFLFNLPIIVFKYIVKSKLKRNILINIIRIILLIVEHIALLKKTILLIPFSDSCFNYPW